MSWITLDQGKTRLGIDLGDATQDAEVQAAIDYATALVETYCQRNFEQATYIENYSLIPYRPVSTSIPLKNWPVVTIDEIDIDDEIVTPTYKLDPVRGVLYFTSGSWYDKVLLKITYTGGYNPVPDDLTNATLDVMAARFYTKDNDPSKGPVKFERIDGSVSVSYGQSVIEQGDGSMGILAPFAMILNFYRSERTQGAW